MFRFSIRDMLWLTVVVAVLMAYLGESYRAATTAREAEMQAVEAAKRAQRAMESRSKGPPLTSAASRRGAAESLWRDESVRG